MPAPFLAALFDLDGTLTPVTSFWQHLHEVLAQWHDDADDFQRQFRGGKIDYATFCRLDAERWKGKPVGELKRIAEAVPLRPGARDLRLHLQRRGVKAGILSPGLTPPPGRGPRGLDLDLTLP